MENPKCYGRWLMVGPQRTEDVYFVICMSPGCGFRLIGPVPPIPLKENARRYQKD